MGEPERERTPPTADEVRRALLAFADLVRRLEGDLFSREAARLVQPGSRVEPFGVAFPTHRHGASHVDLGEPGQIGFPGRKERLANLEISLQ